MTSRTTGRALAAVLLTALTLVAAGLVLPATAATSTGKVKGVITVDGAPIGFAKVQLFRTIDPDPGGDGEGKPIRIATDNTDSKGRYSFSGLKLEKDPTYGEEIYGYTILVTDRTGRTVKTSRRVEPKQGATITKNVHLKVGGIVRGTIATADGRSPAGLTVGVDADFGNIEGPDHEVFYPDGATTVNADGSFTLTGLPANYLYDELTVSDGPYAEQCYDFAAGTLADCAPSDVPNYPNQALTLAKGEQRTVPTVTVTRFAPPATRITGLVTDTSGKPLKGITVTLSSKTASATAVTRSSGRYTVDEGLPADSYVVRFDDPKHTWASQYLGGGPDKSVRQPVALTPGAPIGGLDTRLKSTSSAKFATKVTGRTAKVAVQIKRTATRSAPSGSFTLTYNGVTTTAAPVRKGRASVTFIGLPKGTLSLVATYSGTASTAEFSKIVKVTVR